MTLDDAPLGESALVAATDVEADLVAAAGRARHPRAGSTSTPLHRTSGGGRVLAVGDTRLALARVGAAPHRGVAS